MKLASAPLPLPTCAAVQRSHSRGFTLLELLTVVSIIAVFSAIALPSMVSRMRDRRTSTVADNFANTYRVARMRALGRGSAVLVRYDKSGAQMVTTREAIAGLDGVHRCTLAPVGSCTMPPNRWDNITLYRDLDQFNPFAGTGLYEHTRVELMASLVANGTPSAQGQFDICFTPSGNSFFRAGFQATFAPLATVPYIKAWTEDGQGKYGFERLVYVLPNGVTRVGTRPHGSGT